MENNKKYTISFNAWKYPDYRSNYLKLLQLSLIDQIPPTYYYYFKLYKKENWVNRHNYLYHKSIVHCLKLIHLYQDKRVLNDKFLFEQFCKKNEIPTVQNLGIIKEQKITWFNENITNNPRDFIIKPSLSSQGKGFMRFIFDAKENKFSVNNKTFNLLNIEQQLLDLLPKRYNTFLIQKRLVNHNSFSSFSNDGLVTIRILSIVTKEADIKIIRPIIQIPQGKEILNYYHKGGLIGAIEPNMGSVDFFLLRINNSKHIVKELKIPFWNLIKQDVIKLHQLLKEVPLIGWDVVVTNDGYFFLEGNTTPSLDIHQMPPYTPFISSTFYKILMYHITKIVNQ